LTAAPVADLVGGKAVVGGSVVAGAAVVGGSVVAGAAVVGGSVVAGASVVLATVVRGLVAAGGAGVVPLITEVVEGSAGPATVGRLPRVSGADLE
jgi:hypothetical protein